ncbi:MAG: helicase HerA domain-containing protein, partial [Candidatus Micrarchaeia archaeon]
MKGKVLGSVNLSNLIVIPSESEEKSEIIYSKSSSGIYLGSSSNLSKPFFLDFEYLMNPHIFVVGMTGSGKTFMVKNLMLKLYAFIDSIILLIDFTGEYKVFADFVMAKKYSYESIIEADKDKLNKLFYASLDSLNEKKKIEAGKEILSSLVLFMRTRGVNKNKKFFIIIDEAWKMIFNNSGIETIIREGRKYSVGIILASQLIEDIEIN